MGWDVTVTCSIRKTIHVRSDEAEDEDQAIEVAHHVFSCLSDGTPEKYHQETDDVKEVPDKDEVLTD